MAWYDLETAPGQQLAFGAAPAWDRLSRRIYLSYGWMPVLTDSVRPYEVQVRIFLERYTPQATGGGYYGDVRRWNGVRYVRMRGHAAAAVPGTSNHGKGLAVDITGLGGFGAPRYLQLAGVATSFGWTNDAGRTISEPWHWEYDSRLDQHKGGGGGSITPPTDEDDDMPTAAEVAQAILTYKNPAINGSTDLYGLITAAAKQTAPISRGGESRSIRQEIADTLTAVRALPTAEETAVAVWGVKPTGSSTTLQMLVRVKMRLDNGSAPDAAGLSEVTALDRKVDALAAAVAKL